MTRKKTIIALILMILLTIPVLAVSNDFNVDVNTILKSDVKSKEITGLFSKEYSINSNIEHETLNKEYETLVKKTSYLLLGSPDKSDETNEDFYKRKNDFYDLRYSPNIPTTEDPIKSVFGFDSTSQEFKDDTVSGFSIPGIFKKVSEMEIKYKYIENVKIRETEDGFKASVTVPRIMYGVADENEPTKFKYKISDLTMYYLFKKNKYKNNELQLYYLFGETTDDLNEYFDEIEQNENKGFKGIKTNYDSEMTKLYNFSKLNALSDNDLNKIYNDNVNKVMILSTYFNNSIIAVASGFLLTNNVLATTWAYLEEALMKGQYISVRDKDGNTFIFEGVVTVDINSDTALIKINDSNRSGVILGNSKDMIKEDAVIALSTKSGLGIGSITGIVIDNNNKLQNLLPLTQSDKGSPLFNASGEVIGINTGESMNTSVSYANYTDNLKTLQTKFNSTDKIDIVSFEQLKEKYYNMGNNKEVLKNNIKESIWNKYSKIGNVGEAITLPLIKSSYSNGMLSLRYDNSIKKFIDTKQITLSFVNELKKTGYKELLDSNNKRIYQNNKYKVIIMNEFDYLIIVMVTL